MNRRLVRTMIVTLVTTSCVIWTIHLFDWRQIGATLTRVKWFFFLASGFALVICAFGLRGLRWLIVLGLPINGRRLYLSFCANGAASGLASLTPLQLGEILKIRMVPQRDNDGWQQAIAGFFVERALDLAGVVGMGLCGLALHFGQKWLAILALLLPAWGGQLLYFLGPLTRHLPTRVQDYGKLLHHYKRITFSSLITVLLWLVYAALWWTAISAMNVSIAFDQISLLLGGVMLTVTASMTPGGLGVAELGSQGVLLWLGRSHLDAEAAAIAVRLLTPLLALSGSLCMLLLMLFNKHTKNLGRTPSQRR
ncbi:lysylphosphatidylglycerol synthase transmembrane domain-containing protein [Dyella choica]|uniref:Flippase-like domain-containing protein n=1 Tax=Dyella choica TaxID=1927959 RepID=A0A3S0PKQ6_9GAMM|nr:lysylphosphatidylglycerol synthase transmembrane domain-containing protein [Dyella choica]RUL73099.1 flippase-like domain-containing protein [Dyella choica]